MSRRRTHFLFVGLLVPFLAVPLPGESPRNENTIRKDSYGDALPAEAMMRLGTVRWRGNLLGISTSDKSLIVERYGDFHVLDPLSGRVIRSLKPNRYWTSALSSDCRTLALVHKADIIVYDLATGKEIRRLRNPRERARAYAVSADAKLLAARDKDDVVWLWEGIGEKQPCRLVQATAVNANGTVIAPRHDCLDFSADGTKLASGTDAGTIGVWDTASGKAILQESESSNICSLAYSPNSKLLAWGDAEARVRVWNLAQGKELYRLKAHHYGGQRALAFSPDSKILTSGEWDGSLRFWDMATGKELCRTEKHPYNASRLVYSLNGKHLFATRGEAICEWDAVNGREIPTAGGHADDVTHVVFAPDGKHLISADRLGVLRVWETSAGREIRQFYNGGPAYAFALAPDGSTLVCGGDDALNFFDPHRDKNPLRVRVPSARGVIAVGFRTDGKTLVSYDPLLHTWDVNTGKEIQPPVLPSHWNAGWKEFSPDGSILMGNGGASTESQEVHFSNATTGKALGAYTVSKGRVACSTFSPDSKTLAVWVENPAKSRNDGARVMNPGNFLVLVEVATVQERSRFRVHDRRTRCIAFAADGQTLASDDPDGDVDVWDIPSGTHLRHFHGHDALIKSLAFSPDGMTLASGSADTTILLWKVPSRSVVGEKQHAADLAIKDCEHLWSQLASNRAATAYEAMNMLAAAPKQAVPFLRERLCPVAAVRPERLADLIKQLDHPQFAEREQATRELEKWGDQIEPALRDLLSRGPSSEVRRRAEALLDKLGGPFSPSDLRALRCIELLELIVSPAAKQVLVRLAQGAPEARLTREAKASLKRLASRSPGRP